jgi:hypothetical protein
MSQPGTLLKNFFSVFLKGQTYLNMLYLLLSFPLGIMYFVILITGFAVGIPLIIIWVGLLILLGLFALWIGFVVFERKMAIWLLKVDILPISIPDGTGKTLWQKFKTRAGNPVTWKGLVFLMAKFPIGILCFSVLVSFLSFSLSLFTVPIYYRIFQPVIDLTWSKMPVHLNVIDTLPEALICSLIGFFILLISLHILNGMAILSGKFAKVMLGNYASIQAELPAPVTLGDTNIPATPIQ